MNGFVLYMNLKSSNIFKGEKDVMTVHGSNWEIEYKKLSKFEDDKILFKYNNKYFLLDGVLLNKNKLLNKYNKENLEELLIYLHENNANFYNEFRGQFRGFIFDTKELVVEAYTNHTGEKAIFYYQNENSFILSSKMSYIYEVLKGDMQRTLTYNSLALHDLITNGFLMQTDTIFNEIYRIGAGQTILLKNNIITGKYYYKFTNVPEIDLTEDEILKKLDTLFVQAVKRVFDKNLEYNYNHIADISGGIDSRMINIVANELKYKNITNISYCQSNMIDEKIAKKISKDLGNKFVFYAMDKAEFIYDIDELVKKFDGQELYYVSTGSTKVFNELHKNIGISAMGLLGEILKGEFVQYDYHIKPTSENIYFRASKTLNLVGERREYNYYENLEMYNLYNYGFNYILSSCRSRQDDTECGTPFLDVDFCEFCLKIPIELRKNFYIYKRWILQYHNKAAKYVWQTTMKPLDKKIYYLDIYYKIKKRFNYVANNIFKKLKLNYRFINKNEMNPFDYWITTNKNIYNFIYKYYNENIKFVKDDILKVNIEKMMASNRNVDKLIVINLLATLKTYYVNSTGQS